MDDRFNLRDLSKGCDLAINNSHPDNIETHVFNINSALEKNSSYNSFEKALLYYFLGNLYAKLGELRKENNEIPTGDACRASNRIKAVDAYRKALEDFKKTDEKEAVIYARETKTNLANELAFFNRNIEALPLYSLDFSISGDSPYVSSLAKAKVLRELAKYINDDMHRFRYYESAYNLYKQFETNNERTTYSELVNSYNEPYVQNYLKWFDRIKKDNAHLLDDIKYTANYKNKQNEKYRKWCAENRFFLNNMNDISCEESVEHDILQFPNYSMRDMSEIAPSLAAAFSALTRDYTYARFIAYEGIFNINCPNYEADGLYLINTMDGVDYTLATQKIINAYRTLFSVLDSLTRLIFEYVKPDDYRRNDRLYFTGNTIKKLGDFNNNQFIKSLYWLACEFFNKDTNKDKVKAIPEPAYSNLKILRHKFEHEYVRVVNDETYLSKRLSEDDYAYLITKDTLINSIMQLFYVVRSALIYAMLAIKQNELSINKDSVGAISSEMPIWRNDY